LFSKVIPEHKMKIVKALKNNGEIVAMTGDCKLLKIKYNCINNINKN